MMRPAPRPCHARKAMSAVRRWEREDRSETTRNTSIGVFFFSSRRRHTRLQGDWSSDVCSSDLLHSVGAWLSVAAIGAVIWADRAMARSPRALRLVAPTAAATLVTAPVTAFAFGTVAPIGVVANLVAIPLAAVAVPGLALALALSWIATALARLLAAGAGLGLALLDAVARLAASVPGGHVLMIAGWRRALVWTGVASAAWWLWNSPRRRWLMAARCAFVLTLFCWTSFLDALPLDGGSLA